MAKKGVYIVPTNRWYIERTVWLIAGIVLLMSTGLALAVDRRFMLGVIATGLVSIWVGLTGLCPVGNLLALIGFTPMLGDHTPRKWGWYRMQTDKWYLERRIYVAVGFNISMASLLVLTWTPWWTAFTLFVGGAMVWFAATGFCVMANFLYFLGAEPRLTPERAPSGRCEDCGLSTVCVSRHAKEIAPSLSRIQTPLVIE